MSLSDDAERHGDALSRAEGYLELLQKVTGSSRNLKGTYIKALKEVRRENSYATLEDTYIDCKIKMKEHLNKSRTPVSDSTGSDLNIKNISTNPEVKLPQIQLPSFFGAYEEWPSFHEMFISLIHNNHSLSAVQKLHYLKSSLKGEAEMLLRSLLTTEVKYTEAWDQLVRRYNNKRYNSNEIMKKLFS
ncbi:uncharacterized protein LOC123655122 [Melitaea cinxia]|uniref:uncharacterized protein LOC123655122 n=1 Tax=Melitaea cinxia TaxID=113334 RepID=UPI001E26F53D|nr:uncharacterized protein LOC123655122 [Melitaea cinxia]